ncbi:MAG: hydrogenase 3 maturation endopeptidase HyCI [Candidatus Aminicenantes bacterium]|nr:hydrogenase 3 maturation endopeptidase HyCI [Candidatus Aminicenantes bacterium]
MSSTWRKILEEAIRAANKVVVLAAGNPDKGDDGAGPACAAALRRRQAERSNETVLIIDGRETPESQTGRIRRFGPELTIIIDAAIGGRTPGTIFIVEREKIADEGVSTHTISLLYLVRYLEESIDSQVIVLGIEPSSLELGSPMSPEVRQAVDEIVSELSLCFGKTS